jgi:membrane protease YdiL (CAAX protease family)
LAGCVLLVLRPSLIRATSSPVLVLVAVFSLVGALGAWWPLPHEGRPSAPVGLALAVGVGGFALGRIIGGGHSPGPLTLHIVVLNSLAAVAEEAFFRRLCYGILGSGGAAWAAGGSAILFALVHLTTYGAWVLPIDMAAGLILGWQRWATRSWRVPALTHVVANLFVVL